MPLALNPTRTRVWAPTGVPYELETPGNNVKQVLFGAVNSRSGQSHTSFAVHKRSGDLQHFVDQEIIPAYPDAEFIFLIVDGASIYRSKSTKAWLAERPQIVFVFLPSYAPKLNLQEQLWLWLRHDVTHSYYFRSMTALVKATEQFLAKLVASPEAVLQRIGRTESPLQRRLAQIL